MSEQSDKAQMDLMKAQAEFYRGAAGIVRIVEALMVSWIIMLMTAIVFGIGLVVFVFLLFKGVIVLPTVTWP